MRAAVAIDTSAAIEALVVDAVDHEPYRRSFATLHRLQVVIVFSELLEAELLEAAFTWDLRRRGGDWRRLRRQFPADRPRQMERTIIERWRRLAGRRATRIPVAAVVDRAASPMERFGLGSYDAIHLETAKLVGAPLLTHDRALAVAAGSCPGVVSARGPLS